MSDRWIQEGPRNARIVIVGEAPGATEATTGRPFQGGSGELLSRMLDRVGIKRHECFITNICHIRPPDNKFEWFLKPDNQAHFVRGVLRLKQDIQDINPNLVIGLGAQPLKVLTGKTGIDKWRGSILGSSLVQGVKVISTYHPAYLLRVYDYKAVAEFDLRRCAEEASFPEIRLPVRTHYLHDCIVTQQEDGSLLERPMPDGMVESISKEMEKADWLAVDIECWPKEDGSWALACVGFSDRADRSLVIHNDGPASRLIIRRLLASPVPKVYQNGSFDVSVLRSEGFIVDNFGWDTMLGHHSLYPECASGTDEIATLSGKKRQSAIAKGLAFQASLYTKEPFYKDDGKLWKQDGDLKRFWLYNGRDVAVTREIRDVQHAELTTFGTLGVLDHELRLVEPLLAATKRGIRIDLSARDTLRADVEAEVERLQSFLDKAAGSSINVKSGPQMTKFLYETLKLPKKYNQGRLTSDKDAINELAGKYDNPLLHTILAIRERRDIIERYLNAKVGPDGRMRCSFDITGTRSGRLSSRASLDGTGTNLQTIPSRKKVGERIKRMFIADDGKLLIIRDYKQAEAWLVAYLSRCEGLIELLNDPTRDIHRENASRIFDKPLAQITYEERYLAKRVVHASNYGMGPARLVELVAEESESTGIRITFAQAKALMDKYFFIYPEIKENYWKEIERELRYSRTLNTPFGRKRTFFGRWDDKLLREAYSYPPQSTVGDLGGKATAACYYDVELGRPELAAELLLNVHDSVVMQTDVERVVDTANAMEHAMAIPITVNGQTFTIPTDCKVGYNWGKADESNPNGMRDLDEWLTQAHD